jgi:hypothetical protein
VNHNICDLYIKILKKGWTVKKCQKYGEIVLLIMNYPEHRSFKKSYILGLDTQENINNFKQHLSNLPPYRDLDILGIW